MFERGSHSCDAMYLSTGLYDVTSCTLHALVVGKSDMDEWTNILPSLYL
jgi:hypothetical protein